MAVTRRIDNRGGHRYKLDGRDVTGVTTIISNGVPKPALVPWAAREVATFAADNLDLLAQLERDARIDLLKGSHYRDRDKAARRGTEVHHLGEQLINGHEVEVPEELTAHVDSYLKFLADWNVHPILVEAVVGHRTHKWMGTLDLIARIHDETWLLDIKTTRSGIYGEVALQLAAYRHAQFHLDNQGNEHPMPTVDHVGAIWVRADGYDLVPVEAGPDQYRMFRYCQQVAEFTNTYSKQWVGDVLRPPTDGTAA